MEEIKINDKVIELPIDSIVPHDGSHKTGNHAVHQGFRHHSAYFR